MVLTKGEECTIFKVFAIYNTLAFTELVLVNPPSPIPGTLEEMKKANKSLAKNQISKSDTVVSPLHIMAQNLSAGNFEIGVLAKR